MYLVFGGVETAREGLDDALRAASTEVGNEEEDSGRLSGRHISSAAEDRWLFDHE